LVSKAIALAKQSEQPTLIEIKTTIGFGSVKAGTSSVHGAPLLEDDIRELKHKLNWP
jgi:transketolase